MAFMTPEVGLTVFYIIGAITLFGLGLIGYLGKPRHSHHRR